MATPRVRTYANPGRTQQSQYGFFPAVGTDYSKGDEPTIASRLQKLATSIHLRLTGISGYRTPAHSVEVGGFADDPHTKGEASDTPGIEGVKETVLERFGLTRPFGGPAEADHIQLLNGSTTTSTASSTASGGGPAQWLKQAGWPAALIPIMVAIGGAESSWNIGASHINSDGSEDDGWLQINSVHGYDKQKLKSDPVYTAKAGLAIYKSQGLAAWTTYTSGAYRQFLNVVPRVRSFGGSGATAKSRPGGETPGAPTGPDVTQVLSDWNDARDGSADTSNQFNTDVAFGLPPVGPLGLIPSPSQYFKALSASINDTKDFLKLLAWVINPVNVLRATEFLIGFALIAFGFQAMLQAYGEGKEGFVTSEGALSRSGLGRVSREIASVPRKGAEAAATVAVPEAKAASAVKGGAGKAAAGSGAGGVGRIKKLRPEAAPHRTRRQALRLRYEREKQVSVRRAQERRS